MCRLTKEKTSAGPRVVFFESKKKAFAKSSHARRFSNRGRKCRWNGDTRVVELRLAAIRVFAFHFVRNKSAACRNIRRVALVTRSRAEMFAREGDVSMAGGEAGKKRARIEGTEGRAAPVSPFVATPPSQHLAKILRVRQSHGVDKGLSFARSRARGALGGAFVARQRAHARSELAGPSSPASGLRTPSAPLLARRARASVASLSVCRVEQHETDAWGRSTDASVSSTDSRAFGADDDRRVAEQLETVRLETRKSASGTNAGVSNDEPNAQTYVPGTNMPSAGWMQRCFGCGTWTGQAVSLGAFEVFRCNACARRFRKCADELKARGAGAAAGARDDAADATDARRRGGECHRRAASAESNELTGIASRLREFLLARCPDAGLEHSIANRAA